MKASIEIRGVNLSYNFPFVKAYNTENQTLGENICGFLDHILG